MHTHVANLDAMRVHGGMPEITGAIEQLQAAMARFTNDINIIRKARIQ